VTWDTVDDTEPAVKFDVKQKFRKRLDKANAQRSRQHSLVLEDLLPCTTYVYRVIAKGVAQEVEGNLRLFTTTGCAGDAQVQGTARSDIQPSGGSVDLPEKITVIVPDGALAQESHFQIHQLDREAAFNQLSTPDNLSAITGLYQLGALSDPNTAVETFSQPIEVKLSYTPSDNMDATTITMARHDGTAWQDMSDCLVDQGAQIITCTTTAFSAVAGFVAGASSAPPAPEPASEPQSDGGGGDSGGGGDGGGDDGGSDGGQTEQRHTTVTYQSESGHQIQGAYSGIISDGSAKVAKLAHGKAALARSVRINRNDYWFDVRVKHDRPGPVHMAVYLNNRAWKVIKLNKADNKYYTHRVGKLRDFQGGTIRFRFINDTYDRSNSTNEAADRNLFVDWWRLTTDPNAPAVAQKTTVNTRAKGGGRSAGWNLLPALNTYIRQELGAQHVNFATWQYYAWRLTLRTNHRAVVQTEVRLRTIMRYWKGANPTHPYGEKL
ncbi:MAG: hypothetical protein ACRD4B_06745, partial [Acidobacteriota bacterium]